MHRRDFFLMSAYEAEAYVRGLRMRYRAGWEQARLTAYAALKPYMKDLSVMNDIAIFPWEEARGTDDEKAVDELRGRMPEMAEYLRRKYGQERHSNEAEG